MANRKEMLENCSEKILASEISPQDIPRVIWLNHDQFSYGDIDACYHWLLQEIDNDIRSWMQLLSQGQTVNWQSLIVNVKSHLPEDCIRFLEAHLAHVGKDLKRSAYRYILVSADLELSDSQFMRIRRKLIRYLQSGILRNLLIDNGYLLGDRYSEPPLDSLASDEQLGLADLIALELDDEV